MFDPETIKKKAREIETIQVAGKVTQVVGTIIEGHSPDCSLGRLCHIYHSADEDPVRAEVVGFREENVILMPLGEMRGLKPGSKIISVRDTPTVGVGENLLGRVLNGLAKPLDGKSLPATLEQYPIYVDAINPLQRRAITQPLDVGIRAINGLLTIGRGQRIGILSGTGVGKSVLLGMMARYTTADVNVIALIGERGRELNEFIQRDLGEEGLKRSIVIAATSDTSPLERVRGAFIATAIAEYFRDRGANVLLLMDSLTRFSMAQRSIGLAVGEPPTSKGYTPSVFALMPKLIERAGTSGQQGSITGFYTVLVEGDDLSDPIADAAMSVLDGHIILNRSLSEKNHFPAIDILASTSRLMIHIVNEEHLTIAAKVKRLVSAYRNAETLINIGAYQEGSNPEIDEAIRMEQSINAYARQGILEKASLESSVEGLKSLIMAKSNEEVKVR